MINQTHYNFPPNPFIVAQEFIQQNITGLFLAGVFVLLAVVGYKLWKRLLS